LIRGRNLGGRRTAQREQQRGHARRDPASSGLHGAHPNTTVGRVQTTAINPLPRLSSASHTPRDRYARNSDAVSVRAIQTQAPRGPDAGSSCPSPPRPCCAHAPTPRPKAGAVCSPSRANRSHSPPALTDRPKHVLYDRAPTPGGCHGDGHADLREHARCSAVSRPWTRTAALGARAVTAPPLLVLLHGWREPMPKLGGLAPKRLDLLAQVPRLVLVASSPGRTKPPAPAVVAYWPERGVQRSSGLRSTPATQARSSGAHGHGTARRNAPSIRSAAHWQ